MARVIIIILQRHHHTRSTIDGHDVDVERDGDDVITSRIVVDACVEWNAREAIASALARDVANGAAADDASERANAGRRNESIRDRGHGEREREEILFDRR